MQTRAVEQSISQSASAIDQFGLHPHERYRTLFNSIDQGFCIIEMIFDAAGAPVDYRFVEANPAFERQTGIQDAVGRSMREIAPEHEDSWFEIYGQVAVTGEPVRFTNEAKALDRWFDVSALRVGQPEQRLVAVLFNDITQRKRLEKLQRDFVAMASHDLAAPISVLRARAQLMRRRQQYDAEGMETIIEQTRRMERLLSDLREAVRAETGWREIQPALVDLGALAREAAERAALTAKRKQITVEVPGEPVVGSWDGDRLNQILDNLISNALKYSPADGTVRVTVTNDGVHARLTVADSGAGIPEDVLPRLFDRFYRGEQTGVTPGLGLGLYIVRMLVEAHGGTVWAESKLGEGTTMIVLLPLDSVANDEPGVH